MTEPVDLTRMFGEGWCVTIAPLSVEDTLRVMGVDAPAVLPDGLEQVTQRLTAPGGTDESAVLLLAKPAAPGWTVVLELEGGTGWVGMDPHVLGDLAVDGTTACSAMKNPNQVSVLFAEGGEALSGLDATTGRRWGSPSDRLTDALTAAGFPPDDGEPDDDIGAQTYSQAAVLALETATGVPLRTALTDDTPWTGGLTS